MTIHFDFVHSASAFGDITIEAFHTPSHNATGNLDAPAAANADEKPVIKWNALISVKGGDSNSVTETASPPQQQAPNAGNNKTSDGK